MSIEIKLNVYYTLNTEITHTYSSKYILFNTKFFLHTLDTQNLLVGQPLSVPQSEY